MEGDYIDLGYLCGGVYFNPLPPHGGRQDKLPVEANFENISIHSLRMEGDRVHHLRIQRAKNFNPLPPHGGRHLTDNVFFSLSFISIHSLRMEGDILVLEIFPDDLFQSTPSAWRETRLVIRLYIFRKISIHSLRMEGDDGGRVNLVICQKSFQSTPSAWRETWRSASSWIARCKFQSTPSAWRETSDLPNK